MKKIILKLTSRSFWKNMMMVLGITIMPMLYAYDVTFHADKSVITLAQLRGDKELDLRLYSGRTLDLPKGHYTLIVFPEQCSIYQNYCTYATKQWVELADNYIIEEVTYEYRPETFSFSVNKDMQIQYYVPDTPNVLKREFKYFHGRSWKKDPE